MKIARRLATAAAVVFMLGWLPALPATAAGPMVATVTDSQAQEHELECGYAPGPCTIQYARRLVFTISVSNFSGSPVTFGFQAEPITATPGVDYVPWPYAPPDTVTTDSHGYARVALDVVIDSTSEPTETVRIRLTSTSRPVNITDTGLGTILDGNQLPPDCSATRVDASAATMTCTARPAGQKWQGRFECGGFPPPWARGTTITGSGTSNGTCAPTDEGWMGSMSFNLVP